MGFSFPILQRVVQTSLPRIGRRVGVLLVANVIGSRAGTALTGFLLLDRAGTAGTMQLGRLPTIPVALLGSAFVFVPLLAVMPPSGTLSAHLHGTVVEAMVYAEDGSGLSLVNTDGRNAILYANGIGQGSMPYGNVHTALGALPAFIHSSPRTAAVIGLGSGDTVHAVAGRLEIARGTCVEIIRGELTTLTELRRRFPYGGLLNLLDDGRIEQVFGDGGIHLRRDGVYDIIKADALRPGSAYSGALYSDTYFALVREHLAANGLAATWAPTQRVYNTFIRAFPYVVAMPGILIGSNEPIPMDRAAIEGASVMPPRGNISRGPASISGSCSPRISTRLSSARRTIRDTSLPTSTPICFRRTNSTSHLVEDQVRLSSVRDWRSLRRPSQSRRAMIAKNVTIP